MSVKYLVQRRGTSYEPWTNDSGYVEKGRARARVRMLRRFGDLEAVIKEVARLPKGLPKYDNVNILRRLSDIRCTGPLMKESDFN